MTQRPGGSCLCSPALSVWPSLSLTRGVQTHSSAPLRCEPEGASETQRGPPLLLRTPILATAPMAWDITCSPG